MTTIFDKIHQARHEFMSHNRNDPKHLILDQKTFSNLVHSVHFARYQRYTEPSLPTTFEGLIISILPGTGFDSPAEYIELA